MGGACELLVMLLVVQQEINHLLVDLQEIQTRVLQEATAECLVLLAETIPESKQQPQEALQVQQALQCQAIKIIWAALAE